MAISVDRIHGVAGGLAIKAPVRVATTANIALSGLQTIDGVVLVDQDRVLVKNQTAAADNGIWVATTSSWSRALDFNGALDVVQGTMVPVVLGTVNAGSAFKLDTASPVIGTSSMSFSVANDFALRADLASTASGKGADLVANAMRRYATVADLKAAAAPTIKTVVFVEEYSTGLTAGGGNFYWAPTSNEADNGGTVLIPNSAPANGRWKRAIEGPAQPTWWGADKTGVADATNPTASAITYAISKAIGVHWEAGSYRYAAASASLNPGDNDIVFSGDGYENTIILFEEGTSTVDATRKHLFNNQTSTVKGRVEFRGLQFKGTWTSSPSSRGGAPIVLNYYTEINIHDCRFYDLSYLATWCEAIGRVKFIDNDCERVAHDMCRFRSSFNAIVTGNHFKNCDDDAVALHQQDVITGTGIREGIYVAGNIFEDVLGVKVLGGRMVTVSNNIFRRAKVHAIHVLGDTVEGDCPQFGISIKDNQIYDTLARAPFTTFASSVISVASLGRKGAADTGNIVPGENNAATGAFVLPFPYRNNSFVTAGQSVPAQFFVQITGNTIARTLNNVAAYSDWGYGQAFADTGFSNAAVSAANMRPDIAINLEGDTRKAIVFGNTVSHVGSCVLLSSPTAHFGGDGFVIAYNVLSDYSVAGIHIPAPASIKAMNLAVTDNELDADPYHIHANRGAGGTWTVYGTPFAYRFENIHGTRFCRNHIKNHNGLLFSSYENNSLVQDNVVRCDPAATGFSTSNRGVGDIPAGGVRYTHEIFDCNPTSATYNQQLNATPQNASAQPTTGKWVVGAFVQNVNYGLTIHGWVRTSTGSGHVAGTDWRQINIT